MDLHASARQPEGNSTATAGNIEREPGGRENLLERSEDRRCSGGAMRSQHLACVAGVPLIAVALAHGAGSWHAAFATPIFGIVAPNASNQTLLLKYGTPRAAKEVARAARYRLDPAITEPGGHDDRRNCGEMTA